ncbi:membrane-associated proteins in eicosanoid and glutathione metabolism [Artomyces pyxidatus]|uniref:Membrane-associated proteins in eicosanoid and glutathione metabolism n=1 Tax=Artomyces pyxidatus TaxID=48021 RepID=A0ACB8TCP1_9AGAM|nr:membrane-associated proteins in eicosanoid and glutathione metabolism [Artomyces pyxidatus]
MSSTIVVPAGFSYALASLLSTVGVLLWQSSIVGKARKPAGVLYPRMYAEKAEQEANKDALIYNCKQRAHQNTLEVMPVIVITTLITSLEHPLVAASGCGLWVLGRIGYTIGYASGDPKQRSKGGVIGYFGMLSLLLGSGKVVFDLIMAGI